MNWSVFDSIPQQTYRGNKESKYQNCYKSKWNIPYPYSFPESSLITGAVVTNIPTDPAPCYSRAIWTGDKGYPVNEKWEDNHWSIKDNFQFVDFTATACQCLCFNLCIEIIKRFPRSCCLPYFDKQNNAKSNCKEQLNWAGIHDQKTIYFAEYSIILWVKVIFKLQCIS